jgi:hypothetical protein
MDRLSPGAWCRCCGFPLLPLAPGKPDAFTSRGFTFMPTFPRYGQACADKSAPRTPLSYSTRSGST